MRFQPRIVACDVLVVGGGLAAAAAVKRGGDLGLAVCQVVKGTYGAIGRRGAGASSCGASESGHPRLARVEAAGTDPDHLYHQVRQAGLGTVDPQLAEVMVAEFARVRKLLQKWNIRFDAHGPHHLGYPFVRALATKRPASALPLCEQTMVTDLLLRDGVCIGALAVSNDGEIILFKATAVILATGGDAQLFKHNVHPECVTADGYAMGFRAGAELMNMEFMQIFFCTVFPSRNLFHAWHVDALRNIKNAAGNLILPAYLPPGISIETCLEQNIRHAPFSTRDNASRYLAVAIVKEIQAGRGSANDGIFFDVRKTIASIPKLQYRFLRSRGIDLARAPLEVTMGHQCSNGGLTIDRHAMTSIPGLFAAGEAATGMHGADRLGGHMLSACLVFGVRAVEAAAKWTTKTAHPNDVLPTAGPLLEEFERLLRPDGPTPPDALKSVLQQSAWNNALTIRSGDSLAQFVSDLDQLADEYRCGLRVRNRRDLIPAMELKNLLLAGRLVATAALARTESRGGHYREDGPDCDPTSAAKVIVLHRSTGGDIKTRRDIIDPNWRFDQNGLGSGRWG